VHRGQEQRSLTPEEADKAYRRCRYGVLYNAVAMWVVVAYSLGYLDAPVAILVAVAVLHNIGSLWTLRYCKRLIFARVPPESLSGIGRSGSSATSARRDQDHRRGSLPSASLR
jgi:hypothetical protein